MSKKIGITGGIGAGKSLVAKLFHLFGIPCYNADERAKHLIASDASLRQGIKDLLGEMAFHENGTYNRAYVANKVFDNQSLLTKLNHLVHPAVGRDYEQWHAQQTSPYTLKEAALLVENKSYRQLDGLVVVEASEATRIKRVQERDNRSEEAIKSIINKQATPAQRLAAADYLIDNGGTKSLIKQSMAVHESILEL